MSKITLWITVYIIINSLVLASNTTWSNRERAVGVRSELAFSSHLKAAFWMCLALCARQIIVPKVLLWTSAHQCQLHLCNLTEVRRDPHCKSFNFIGSNIDTEDLKWWKMTTTRLPSGNGPRSALTPKLCLSILGATASWRKHNNLAI